MVSLIPKSTTAKKIPNKMEVTTTVFVYFVNSLPVGQVTCFISSTTLFRNFMFTLLLYVASFVISFLYAEYVYRSNGKIS